MINEGVRFEELDFAASWRAFPRWGVAEEYWLERIEDEKDQKYIWPEKLTALNSLPDRRVLELSNVLSDIEAMQLVDVRLNDLLLRTDARYRIVFT